MKSKFFIIIFLLLGLIFYTKSNQNEPQNIRKFYLEVEDLRNDINQSNLEILNKLIEGKE
jgi:hypothetical protein